MAGTRKIDWRDLERQQLEALPGRLHPDDWKRLRSNVEFEAVDLELATTAEILALFPGTSGDRPGSVNDARLIRTYLWQLWLKIQTKQAPPVEGNIRSTWYQALEPFYQKHDLIDRKALLQSSLQQLEEAPIKGIGIRKRTSEADRIATNMTEILGEFIYSHVFRFSDFLYQEPIDHRALVGRDKPRNLYFTEKEGLWRLAKELHEDKLNLGNSISVMASNGQPSLLALDYFCQGLINRGVRRIVAGCFSDFDPWGYLIAQGLDDKLRFLGFDVTTYYLTSASLFSPQQIAHGRDFSNLDPINDKALLTLVNNWLAVTNGVDGRPIGLHIDVLSSGQKSAQGQNFRKWAILGQAGQWFPVVQPLADKYRNWKTPRTIPKRNYR